MKKIVVLNGSPQRNGNTSALVAEFVRGAKASGNEVAEFWLHGMEIHGCQGCYGGGKEINSPCVQKDDMDKIYPAYRHADVVVFASPLYYLGISGQLKTCVDRLFADVETYPTMGDAPKKSTVLIVAAHGDGFGAVQAWHKTWEQYIGWKNLGEILCPGVVLPGDVKGHAELRKAYELGKSIA